MNEKIVAKKWEIYIGLSDKDLVVEKYTLLEAKKIAGDYCKEKNVAFSITELTGGYGHNNGYIIENSLKITLIGIDEKTLRIIGDKLKKVVNTDTIMYTSEECEVIYI